MRRFYALLAMTLMAASGPARAEYVSANGVNCRAAPTKSARVITTLSRGQRVSVKRIEADWALVSGEDCWALASYLSTFSAAATTDEVPSSDLASRSPWGSPRVSDGDGAIASQPFYSSPRISVPRDRLRVSRKARTSNGLVSSRSARSVAGGTRRSSSRSRGSSGYIDGQCPCSGSRICIGPRGGRYCITSGGNKRYGV